MTAPELRSLYALTPSITGDTIHALQVVRGCSIGLIAAACRTSTKTIADRLRAAGHEPYRFERSDWKSWPTMVNRRTQIPHSVGP